ncbi:uncharacterized protein BJ171DRAFT_583034 [Polychytrium aggregatum]|uniref:uncharacterized protein n=1 Tax=Polychytrium aggregatum TaxID=110093 RepID=UPI0022FE7DC3|nr:uncharacterized protein BJ171DRAFT_583034 [Polychytrium aggregatum]KAI9203538.1 hypothetical protein BJ171DRAFT_583034 [Polychytrium aggregatum]
MINSMFLSTLGLAMLLGSASAARPAAGDSCALAQLGDYSCGSDSNIVVCAYVSQTQTQWVEQSRAPTGQYCYTDGYDIVYVPINVKPDPPTPSYKPTPKSNCTSYSRGATRCGDSNNIVVCDYDTSAYSPTLVWLPKKTCASNSTCGFNGNEITCVINGNKPTPIPIPPTNGPGCSDLCTTNGDYACGNNNDILVCHYDANSQLRWIQIGVCPSDQYCSKTPMANGFSYTCALRSDYRPQSSQPPKPTGSTPPTPTNKPFKKCKFL